MREREYIGDARICCIHTSCAERWCNAEIAPGKSSRGNRRTGTHAQERAALVAEDTALHAEASAEETPLRKLCERIDGEIAYFCSTDLRIGDGSATHVDDGKRGPSPNCHICIVAGDEDRVALATTKIERGKGVGASFFCDEDWIGG